jgi:hypothetical protein
MNTKCLLENLKERDQLENLGKWEDYIKMDHKKRREVGVKWIHQDGDQRQDLGEHGNEPSGSVNC